MRITPQTICKMKGAVPIVCLTAYTAPMAGILDAHCDLLLVGDSLGMVLYGMKSTTGVDLDMMIRHGRAVVQNSTRACVVIDMPAGTYEGSPTEALENARRIMKETGCSAVKLEGGTEMVPTVSYLVKCGVPVMGHIGLLPQSDVYKIKGKTEQEAEKLIADAKALEKAGVFSFVIEGTIEPVAHRITEAVKIPTIGIGASRSCDGQVLVSEDMLGLFDKTPKFVKIYADLKKDIFAAAEKYASDVRTRKFPDEKYIYKKS